MGKYDDLISGGQTPEPANKYDGILQNDQAAQSTGLRQSMLQASKRNPDQYAKILGLSQASGLPPGTVERNKERVESEVGFNSIDYDGLIKNSPALASQLSDPDFAGIASDEIENLRALEQRNREYMNNTTFFGRIGDRMKEGWLGLQQSVRGMAEQETIRMGNEASTYGFSTLGYDPFGLPIIIEDPRVVDNVIEMGQGAAERLAKTTAEIQAQRQDLATRPATEALMQSETFGDAWEAFMVDPLGVIGDIGTSSSVQMAPSLIATIVTRKPVIAATAAGMNSSSVEIGSGVVDYMAKNGVDVSNQVALEAALENNDLFQQALAYARLRGAIIGTFDAASGGLASLNAIPDRLVRNKVFNEALNTFLAQPAIQASLGAGGEASAQLATEGEISAGEVLAEALGETFTAPVEAFSFAIERYAQANQAQTDSAHVDQMIQDSQSSKVRERNPQAYEKFIAKVTEGTDIQDIYIPAEKFVEYFQSQGIDPNEIASQVAVDGNDLAVAINSGGDVKIPASKFAAYIAPEHGQGLADDIRLRLDGMTRRELSEVDEQAAAQEMERILFQQEGENAVNDSSKQVYDNVRQQLIDAGRVPEVADNEASVFAAFFRTMAARTGRDAMELFRERKITVEGEVSNQVQEVTQKNPVSFKSEPSAPGRREFVSTARNNQIETMFEVMEADDLVTSDNENFPKELQPRDRDRDTSAVQVRDIAAKLDPTRLGSSAEADRGAPIIGDSNVVESGNGRVMALREVFASLPERAQAYRDYLEEQGIDTSGFKNPVLVRRRLTPMDAQARRGFVVEANEAATATMSATEQANADKDILTDAVLSLYRPADITSAANADFVRAFINAVPAARRGEFIGSQGQLSSTGLRRIEAAMLGKAYGGNENSDLILQRMTESTDDNARSITGAMLDVAPLMARLRQDIEEGNVKEDFNITGNLVDAISIVSDSRAKGQNINEVVNQAGLFGDIDPITEQLIRSFYQESQSGELGRARGRQKIAGTLLQYINAAESQRVDQGGLFDLGDITPQQILSSARQSDAGIAESLTLFQGSIDSQSFFDTIDMFADEIDSEMGAGGANGNFKFKAEDSPLYQKRTRESVGVVTDAEAAAALETDATSRKILAKGHKVEDGQLVGARLNINVLKNTGVPVVTVHKATNKDGYTKGKGFYRGEVLTYQPAVTMRNVFMNVDQKGRSKIATGEQSKFPMASVDGEYADVSSHNYDGVEFRFNPHREHTFIDRYGRALKSAGEVTIYGDHVFARGEIEYFSPEEMPDSGGVKSAAVLFDPEKAESSYTETYFQPAIQTLDNETRRRISSRMDWWTGNILVDGKPMPWRVAVKRFAGEEALKKAEEAVDRRPLREGIPERYRDSAAASVFGVNSIRSAGHTATLEMNLPFEYQPEGYSSNYASGDYSPLEVGEIFNMDLEDLASHPDIVEAENKILQGGDPTINIETEERQQLREDIASDLYGDGAPKKERKVWLVLGPPASGKSSLVEGENGLAAQTGSMVIDSDMAKERLPEFEGGVGANRVHEESKEISSSVMMRAIENGDNIVEPIVGGNYDKIIKRVEMFRANGYDVGVRLVDLPIEETFRRSIARFVNTGRFIPPEYIFNEVGYDPVINYLQLVQEGVVDDYQAFSSAVAQGEALKPRSEEELFEELSQRQIPDPLRGRGPGRYDQGKQNPQGSGNQQSVSQRQDGGSPGAQSQESVTLNQEKPTLASRLLNLFSTIEDKKRGSITLSNISARIKLLSGSDLTTFLHENAHLFLDIFQAIATAPDAPAEIKADWEIIAKYLGVKDGAKLTEAQQEVWASSFEKYLFEGKAPSIELQSVFSRVKAWMINVYKRIQNIKAELPDGTRVDVNLTDEVRAVMDRMLATQEEIDLVERQYHYDPILSDIDGLMTDQELAEYSGQAERATEEAKEFLLKKALSEVTRESKDWWREAKRKMAEEVAAEINERPEYLAQNWLRTGEMLNGATSAMEHIRLDIGMVRELGFDPKKFPIMTQKDGVHPDSIAPMFGYQTGKDMLDAILAAAPRSEVIKQETDSRMKAEHGDILNDGSIEAAAVEAIHFGDERAKFIQTELRMLARKAGYNQDGSQRPAPLDVVKNAAKRIIGSKPSREAIQPGRYSRDEIKAAKAAALAIAKGDFAEAVKQKRRQQLNHQLFRESLKAQKELDGMIKYFKKFSKKSTREKLGKAGEGYLAQVESLLERYDFKPASLKSIDKRKSLAEWAGQQEALGNEVNIDPKLLNEARRVHYRDASMDELVAVKDAIRSIERLSDLKNKLIAGKKLKDFNEAKDEMIISAEENTGAGVKPPLDKNTIGTLSKIGSSLKDLDASLLKMEQVIAWLDGDKPDGPWRKYLWEPIADAQHARNDLDQKITAKVIKAFEKLPNKQLDRFDQQVRIESMNENLTIGGIMAIAMNMGSESNYDKLLKGYRWKEDQVAEAVSHLTDSEWNLVQDLWDIINGLWPEIEQLEKDLNGVAPEKVAARSFVSPTGREMKGGYYPLVYDPRHSSAGQKQISGDLGSLFDEGYEKATTPKGHTKERVENFAAPIMLDINVIPNHLSKVTHDLTHRKPIMDGWKIINDPEMRRTLQSQLGEEYEKMFLPWLKSVANDRMIGNEQGLGWWMRQMQRLRLNTSIVAMGFKWTTMVAQPLGLTQSIDVMRESGGKKYLAKGLRQFWRSPTTTKEFVFEKSGEMRHRMNNLDRDLRDNMRRLTGKDGVIPDVQRFAMMGIGIFDMTVSLPTWIGSYQWAIDQGMTEDQAVSWADSRVRLSQGTGGAKDLAAIQRNHEATKMLTLFYSYFNTLYNRLRDVGRKPKDFPAVLARSFWLVMIPAIFSELLAGRGPDDDEDWDEWAARKIAIYPFMAVPVLRDVVSTLDSGYGYRYTPAAQGIEDVTRLAKGVEGLVTGDKDLDEVTRQAIKTSGYFLGLPTNQLDITGGYLWDLATGEEDDINPAWLLYRRPKD